MWTFSRFHATFLDVDKLGVCTSAHIKPTNHQQYLHFSSYHPPNTPYLIYYSMNQYSEVFQTDFQLITCRKFVMWCYINYRNKFVTHTSLAWIYGKCFQRSLSHCQPMTTCCEFRFLVGTDLLPSTGFKMNFLVKWSAVGFQNL